MFKKPVVINSDQHSRLRFTPADNFSFAAQLTHVPVLAGEIVELAKSYPIVFAADTGLPVALLSVTQAENLYLDEKNVWHAPAVPASCKNYPFGLVAVPAEDGSESEEQRFAVVVDEEADTLQEKDGKLLYNKSGESFRPSPFLKQMQEQLVGFERASILTKQFFRTLLEQEVLAPSKATFTINGEERHLDGFARVDWDRVQNIPAEVLGQWQETGMMDVLTAHSESMNLIDNLVAAATKRAELHAQSVTQ